MKFFIRKINKQLNQHQISGAKFDAGFTMIELMVVIFIFLVISTLVIFNYRSFNSSVSLQNLAQDIGLAIRKAQVYSTSTKSASALFPSYGVHFSLTGTDDILGHEKAFVLFADVPTALVAGMYEQSSTNCGSVSGGSNPDECVEIIKITTQDKISELCAENVCYDKNDNPRIDISFTRPYPEAKFCVNGSCGTVSNVTIRIESAGNLTKDVLVWSTGQIDIK